MNIITLTLNPAFDVHCHIDDFRLEHEHLASVISRDAGGKGVNISRALTKNGVENLALVVLGEENAADFRKGLETDGMSWRELVVPGRIRENITIHTNTSAETRISFNGFAADATIFERIADLLCDESLSDCVVTFTGRVPEGIPMHTVKQFLRNLRTHGARIVIDSKSFSLDDLIECRPWMIKPNEEKIAAYLGRTVDSFEELADTALVLHRKGIANVMISLGEKGAMLACTDGVFIATPPSIVPLSTIGAGDSSIAGFLAAAKDGADARTCICLAVSYGTAACMTQGTLPPRAEDVAKILETVRCVEHA